MLSFPLIYSDGYDLNFGQHVFASRKYKLIRDLLLDKGVAGDEDLVEPVPATRDELIAVHDATWVDRLSSGRLTYHEILKLEVPYSRTMVDAAYLNAGGSIAAARMAVERGAAFSIGGGFHHAFSSWGEGFCPLNDIAVAVRAVQRAGLVKRVLIVDCDVHQANGTAAIFAADADVYTVSAHQDNNYPYVKPPSDLDIGFADGTGDREYVARLEDEYGAAVERFQPQLVFYVSGADPFFDDQLGGLALSKDGLYHRDRVIFNIALKHGAAVAVTLAGGYARYIEDTVEIHANTALALRDSLVALAK